MLSFAWEPSKKIMNLKIREVEIENPKFSLKIPSDSVKRPEHRQSVINNF